MTKEIWLNLPVKDVNKSKAFFTELGFTFNEMHGNPDQLACMYVGEKNIVIMLCSEPAFRNFTQHDIADTSKSSEILLSIDAENRDEVDAIAEKVVKAGGTLFAKPSETQGWMYGCGFIDLDGHRWNVLFMDLAKNAKKAKLAG